jgi:predicted AAA+ superfamily ATPase
VRQQTLQDYLDIVIYRDIIERHKVKNPTIVKYMILSLIHNVGNPFTINKFYNELRSQGYQTGKDILYEYADHIEDAYLAFFLEAYDTSLRKRRALPKKNYAIDPGMVQALVLNHKRDLGRLFENVIFLDLKRLGGKISYYRTASGKEVDFVIETPLGRQKCFQVTWNQEQTKTFEREQRGLEEGMRELRMNGEIITLDSYLEKGLIV